MRERFVQFFLRQVLRDLVVDVVRVDFVGNWDDDERQEVTVRLEEQPVFMWIFGLNQPFGHNVKKINQK
ncbi:MAG: hypothetical protein A2W62_02830 [Alphaproteobacteria bacterium RIFCSPLOWO2_02_42_7]|nr:MAG: hypothetical protein A2W62_02830 [Alphaproteobacteria bacterium RIFCSPLOWO2_02_42_7]